MNENTFTRIHTIALDMHKITGVAGKVRDNLIGKDPYVTYEDIRLIQEVILKATVSLADASEILGGVGQGFGAIQFMKEEDK